MAHEDQNIHRYEMRSQNIHRAPLWNSEPVLLPNTLVETDDPDPVHLPDASSRGRPHRMIRVLF